MVSRTFEDADEIFFYLPDNNETLCSDAALPIVDEPALCADCRRQFQIGIGKYKIGLTSTKF